MEHVADLYDFITVMLDGSHQSLNALARTAAERFRDRAVRCMTPGDGVREFIVVPTGTYRQQDSNRIV